MIDKENLRIGLEEVSDFFFEMYKKETDEYKATKAKEYCDIVEDALSLLKEQEAKHVQNIGQLSNCESGLCPNCRNRLNTVCNKNFCGDCGQAVKWE